MERVVIFLTNVSKLFGGRPLFKGFNLSVQRGDRIGIVGPNGAGKSTLLGIMEGTVSADEGDVATEKRIRMGVLHQELIKGNDRPVIEEVMQVTDDLKRLQDRLARLEAEMEDLSEDSDRVDAVLEEHGQLLHEFERFGGYSLEAKALKVLHGLGFRSEDARRRWSEFSGGWRMRVALAKILLAEPDVLLLDEPTNHLDLESLLWVEDYLATFQGAIVIVSHDRAFLNRLVKRIVEVDRGKATMFTGTYDDYERTKQMQEEVTLAAYKNQQVKIKRIQKFIDTSRVKARTASRVQSRLKMLDKLDKVEPPTRARTIRFNFPQPTRTGKRVVEMNGVVKRYGPLTVYDGLDFALDRGDRIALVGPNGAGKSTLMKLVAGVLRPDGGMVKYGHLVNPGYFAQHQYEHLNPERTVLDEAAASGQGMPENELRSLLGAFLFTGDDAYKKVKVLSGGEKSRLALTKILLSPPNLLLLDEPTNHLDIPSCQVLEQALAKYEGTLLLITHDRRLMNEICTGILEIRDGTATYYPGTYDDYQYKKRLMEKAELEKASEEKPASAQTTTPAAAPKGAHPAATPSVEDRKARKRMEAHQRNTLHRQRAPILEQIRVLEKQLHQKEARIKTVQEQLADPKNYEAREKILPLLEEDPALAKEIKILESRWEDLHAQLEEIDSQARAG